MFLSTEGMGRQPCEIRNHTQEETKKDRYESTAIPPEKDQEESGTALLVSDQLYF